MDGRYFNISNEETENKRDWNYDTPDKGRPPPALQKLVGYVTDPKNHLKKYQEEVATLLQTALEEFEQTTNKDRTELEQKITILKKDLKTSETNRVRYRNERNDLKEKYDQERNRKNSNEQIQQIKREIDELKRTHELKERDWSKKLKDSEETSDEIVKNLKEKLEQTKKDIEHRDVKNRGNEKILDKSKFGFSDRSELQKKIDLSQKQLNDTHDRLNRALSKLKQTEKELEVTKTRLSKAMGDKLTDNNPNIADLSDRNRPTKLAEQYVELYDNQWTDAFEDIETRFGNEEDVIKALLEILQNVMDFCKTEAKTQMENLQRTLTCSDYQEGTLVPANITKQLKELRKVMSAASKENLFKVYLKSLRKRPSLQYATEIEMFVKECFQICWLMAIQDPPIVFSPMARVGEALNTDLYRPYTSSGRHIQFVVWPALLLHKDGPVLAKGVAQGTNDNRREPKIAWVANEATMQDMDISDKHIRERETISTGRYQANHRSAPDHVMSTFEDKRYTKPTEDRHHRSGSAEVTRPSYSQSTVVTTRAGTSPNSHSASKKVGPTRHEMIQYFNYIDRRDYSGARNALGHEAYMRCLLNDQKRHLYC